MLFRAFLGSNRRNSLIYTIVRGEEGIRTPGTRKRTPVFEAGSFNHSDTSPEWTANLRDFFQFAITYLLEPLVQVFFRVQIVDGSAQPGEEEQEDDGDHFSGHGNLFLQDVDRSDDADNFADEDDGFIKHDSVVKGFLTQKYKKDGGMQALFFLTLSN